MPIEKLDGVSFDRFGFNLDNPAETPIGLLGSTINYPTPGSRDKLFQYIQIQSLHIAPDRRRLRLLQAYRHKIDLALEAASKQYLQQGNIHAADALLT